MDCTADWIHMVQMSMKGNGLMLFESAVNNEMSPDNKAVEGCNLSNKIIAKGLQEVATDIFPCCALFCQKKWMEREMKKPHASSARQTIAINAEMNNALLWFPRATQASKFNNARLLELMECMLPQEF